MKNNEIDKFDKILERFDFVEPISDDVQKFAIKSRNDNLNNILKKTGNYSLFFGISTVLFFLLKKIGIQATLFQAKVLTAVVSINVAIVTVASGGYATKIIVDKIQKPKEQEEILPEVIPTIDQKNLVKPIQFIKCEFGVQTFSGSSTISNVITNKIASNLKTILGSKKVTLISKNRRYKTSKMILGTVRELGGIKIVTAKIIDVKSSKVEFVTSEEFSGSNYDKAIETISLKLSQKLK